jgi:beta-lactamase regulating signal transducer with metallopeptidase domain
MSLELLAHPAARALTLALVHFLWQGLAIAILLAATVELLGIRRAPARYACSLAALLAMLACPLVTLAWLCLPASSAIGEPVAWAVPTMAQGGHSPPYVQDWLAPYQPLALAAWLVGVILLGGRLLAGAIGLSRLRRTRQPLPLNLAALVERLGRRLRVEALPLVFVSRQVSEAMAVGLVRPLVLIPAAWLTEMPLPMLEAVIAHELAHLRRRDLWVNLLQRLAETLLFYHPAVWWLSRRLRTERELCADELAVAATGRRLEYAQALEQVAHRRQAEIRPALAAFMRGETNMRVLERVRNVLGLAGGERPSLWPVGIVALALPAVLLAAAGWPSATAQDVEKPAVRRDGERPDQPKKDAEARFFGKDAPREGEVRKDAPRDGEVKKGPRDGEIRKEGPRDGEPRTVIKKEGPRDDEPRTVIRKEGARDGDPPPRDLIRKIEARDGDRPAGEAAQLKELTALVKRLSQQVERLQAEVSALRGGKPGTTDEPGGYKEAVVRRLKEAALNKEALKDKQLLKDREGLKEAIEREASDKIEAARDLQREKPSAAASSR